MESLGHYLLRERIVLPGVGAMEAFEGQDVRTGIDVLAFRPIAKPLPELSIPHTLPWIDQEGDAWIAEIPVGAVKTAWLAGRLDIARLTQWCKQLVTVLHWAQERDIPVGYVIPELIWARGSRIWLGGVGVPNPEHARDFSGLLNTIKVFAGEAYPALPWREALEDYVAGHRDYTALLERLEFEGETPASKSSSSDPQAAVRTSPPAQDPSRPHADPLEARRARAGGEGVGDAVRGEGASSSLEARRARAGGEGVGDAVRGEGASSSLEARRARAGGEGVGDAVCGERAQDEMTPDKRPAKATSQDAPDAEKQTHSKSLNVEVNEPAQPAAASTPPRRIRIEERLEPPFEVLEPPLPSRRTVALWIWLIPLVLLLAGLGWWMRSRTPSPGATAVYPVEFRLQPPGPGASLAILEAPEGSQMPLNTEIAQLPGRVDFDRPGIYRIRVRVQGRAPVESLIEVPNPGGVTISLQ
ncbi:hypothetical protein [Meiothermus ruber]|jgi:hypothetical protein|uniref:PEGA domain-containing protein n=1 Tax=Meiothermus ruber (strain ATCC 35948 / DSM 1279 / VKM B-1258 / 21) TaxID=504728 RepID=D3PTB1_MEIRD|nr:hypothetical protein [Meiothermus ruber]ADD28694.1 hypothetical protein Mrub_1938 [Meiothermus ruber DSM 1279]AGK05860.1 hypothetical protein K649_12870 [Meiothermus ruber DSM 1279]